MSTGNKTTVSGPGGRAGPPPTQKLKDSCDMCSSSKVKCNKDKPVCSRCRKLGYPCFYSPARRIGRPHPNRRKITRKSPEPRPNVSGTDSAINQSVPDVPQGIQGLYQHSRLVSETQPSILDEIESSSGITCGLRSLHWLDEVYIPTGGVGETETNTTSCGSYVFSDDFNQKQTLSVPNSPLADLDIFNFPGALNGETQWLNRPESGIDLNFIPFDFSLAQSISQSSSAGAPDAMELTSCGQTPLSDSSEADCVIGAIEILRRLQVSNEVADEVENSQPEKQLLSRVQTASWAINRLSTILVCPCARKAYVGVLVATVCTMIMDIYGPLSRRSHEQKAGDCIVSQSQDMNMRYSLDLNVDPNKCTVAGYAESADFESDESETHMPSVHILEELSKLANVVMQFARRYKGDSSGQPVGTLSALADALKLRLRSITNEALEKGLR